MLTFLELQKLGIGEKPPSITLSVLLSITSRITLSHTIIALPQQLILSKTDVDRKSLSY